MATAAESVRNFAQDRVCTFLGNAGNFWGAVGAVAGDTVPGQVSSLPAVAGAFQNAYRSVCNREPPAPIREGGDCNVAYGIRSSHRITRLDGVDLGTFRVDSDCAFAPFIYGPVSGASFETNEVGFSGYVVFGYDGAGGVTKASVTGFTDLRFNRPPELLELEFYPCNPADTCDPSPIPPTQLPFPRPQPSGDITYVNNDGIDITIPVGVVVEAPSLDIRGNINMPIRLDFGGNTLNFSPQVTFNLSSEGGGVIQPAPIPRPDWRDRRPIERITRDRNGDELPVDTGRPYPDFPPESARGVMTGAVVVALVSSESRASIISQGNNPDIYAPSLGHINFTYGVGGVNVWSQDIPVKNDRQFIPCPLPTRAIGVEGTAQPGVEIKIFPVFQSIEAYFGYDLTNA